MVLLQWHRQRGLDLLRKIRQKYALIVIILVQVVRLS